jgi:iron complex outermembrane recepter protein
VESAGITVSRDRRVDLENFNPENRGVFTYSHNYNDFRLMVRASYYDDWTSSDWSADPTPRGAKGTGYTLDCTNFRDNCYNGETIVDIEGAYTFNENYTLILGANNVFDQEAPIHNDNRTGLIGSGNTYTTTSPWGMEGAFYYARFRVDF